MATSTQINAITALYVGYFDRAPDPEGLQFWIDQLDNGREYNTIAADFAASPEAVALYPYLTTPDVSSSAAFITNIYANLFGREPDTEGLEFWTGVLEDGSVSVADMIEEIILGARDDADAGTFDKAVLDNKVEAGLDFAQETGNVPGFEFDAVAKAAAVAAVNGVTEDEATVEAAKAATDAFVDDGVISGIAGETFTLTADADTIEGTSGDDLIRGPSNDSLDTLDVIKGGAGIDTLRANVTDDDAAPVMSGVENVFLTNPNNSSTAGSSNEFGIDLDQVTGVQQLWAINADTSDTGGWPFYNNDGQASFTARNVSSLATIFGTASSATAMTYEIDLASGMDIDGDDDTLQIAVDDNDTNTVTYRVNGAADTDVETISVLAAGDDDGTADEVNLSNFDGVETITVTGSGDIDFGTTIDSDDLETFDASAATGEVTADLSNTDNDDLMILGGSGDDYLVGDGGDDDIQGGAGDDYIDGGFGDDTIQGGAGNDTLDGGAGDDMLEGGAGADVMSGNGGDNAFIIQTSTIEDLGFDEITDFISGSDTVNFGGPEGSAANYAEATATGAGFVTARSAAETLLDGDSELQYVAVQETGGATYVFYDGNGDSKLDADGTDFAVEITGGIANFAFSDIVA